MHLKEAGAYLLPLQWEVSKSEQSEHPEPKMEICCKRLLPATPTTAMGMASPGGGGSFGKPRAPSPTAQHLLQALDLKSEPKLTDL